MKKILFMITLLTGLATMWWIPANAIEDCGDTGCVSGPDTGTTTTDDGGTTITFPDPNE